MKLGDEMKDNLSKTLKTIPIIESYKDDMVNALVTQKITEDALKKIGYSEEEVETMLKNVQDHLAKQFAADVEKIEDSEMYKQAIKAMTEIEVEFMLGVL